MDRGDVLVDWRLLARLAMLGVLGVYFVRTLIDSGKPEVLDFDVRLARNLPSRVAPTPARGAAAAPQPARPQPRPTSLPSPRVTAPAVSSATRATNETACSVCAVAANGDRSCCHPGGSWSGQCGSGLAHSWRDGYRACNDATCARCGTGAHAAVLDVAATDLNCCHPGGSWHGRCGPPADGRWPFSFKEGYRACNNLSLAEPAPERVHNGPLVPLRLASGGTTAVRSGLRVYFLSLLPEAEALAKARNLTATWLSDPAALVVLRGVAAADALSVAGVPAGRARDVFGYQALQPEFLAALGCALSHLRAAARALADGAAPALILEEDAVADLQPYWLASRFETLLAALPGGWEAVQLSALAEREDWSALRARWREEFARSGTALQLRRDFYWSTAAYLLSPRGLRALVNKFRMNSTAEGWRLGVEAVRCVKADDCVVFPSLRAAAVYVAVPPLFTCSEREPSAIDGHDGGHQREVHWNSRLQSLDFAAEAHRARVEAAAAAARCPPPAAGEAPPPLPMAGGGLYVRRSPDETAASVVVALNASGTFSVFERLSLIHI